jgi:hypothetical protein
MFVYGQWLVIPSDKLRTEPFRTILVKQVEAIGVVTPTEVATTLLYHVMCDPAASGGSVASREVGQTETG